MRIGMHHPVAHTSRLLACPGELPDVRVETGDRVEGAGPVQGFTLKSGQGVAALPFFVSMALDLTS
jgi:hypothetical protein